MQDKRLKRRQTTIKNIFDLRFFRIALFAVMTGVIYVAGNFYKTDTAPVCITFAAIFVVLESVITFRQKRRFIAFLENFDFCLSDTTGVSLVKYPSPIIIIDMNGEIKWYNGNFKALMGGKEVFGCKVQSLLPEISINKLTESQGVFGSVIRVGSKVYEIEARLTGREDSNKKHKFLLLYFIDKTDEYTLSRLREEERTVEAIVIIDNYEEVLKETPDSNHGKILGEIEQKIGSWIAIGNGTFRKFEHDKFLVIFEQRNFEKILDNKFEILNEIRNINFENRIPVTISIGIGQHGADPRENDNFAKFAIDMALGRGGDQVVI